jgi:thiamine biosynthesis lipoprotein
LEAPSDIVAGWEIALTPLRSIHLSHRSIGSSGSTVKGAHILDPRTGQPPAEAPFRTWALSDRAAVSDALSTAWMLLDEGEIGQVCKKIPGTEAVLLSRENVDEPLVWIPANS